METFVYGVLDDVASLQESQTSTDVEPEKYDEEADNVWTNVPFDRFNAPQRRARTWEQFYDKGHQEKQIYLSEAGPAVWDAAWMHIEGRRQSQDAEQAHEQRKVYQQDLLLSSLFELGLGLSSQLFAFSDGKAHARAEVLSASGLSSELTANLVFEFAAIGQRFQGFTRFTREVEQKDTCSSEVAVAAAVECVVNALNRSVIRLTPTRTTLLQLKGIFSKPKAILEKLSELLEGLSYPKTRDVEAIDHVYNFAKRCESIDPWFRPIALHILERVVRPFFQVTGSYLGLGRQCHISSEPNSAFAAVIHANQDMTQHEDNLTRMLEDSLPSFMELRHKKALLNTAQGLELLEAHDKSNVLVSYRNGLLEDVLRLDVAFSWEDIERIQAKAFEYERSIRSTLNKEGKLQPQNVQANMLEETPGIAMMPFDLDEEHIAEDLSESYNVFNGPVGAKGSDFDNVSTCQAVDNVLQSKDEKSENSGFLPPLSLALSASILPVLAAQSRLVNRACLKMLFQGHHLVHHFELQHQFQLLGSGLFSSRLSQALFSTSLSSAERRKGHTRAGLMGLRLGSRETWPPASAELRLVLMGILSESYKSVFPSHSPLERSDDLPGGLSFAVRNLSEPEIEACLDSSSLQALDFLRLQYRPPCPLDAVITESALEKYDRIFRFLMRINRVSFATTRCSSPSAHTSIGGLARVNVLLTRFRIEARHFVSSLSLYIHSCISSLWTRFFSIVQATEDSLRDDALDQLGEGDGFSQLRQLHEVMLDQLLFELLLRKRQERVMEVLEDILSHVLEFTQLEFDPSADGIQFFSNISNLYSAFLEKVKLFIAVCKGLGEKGAYKVGKSYGLESTMFARGWKAGEDSSEGIESLVVMLDMNKWYQK